MVHAHLALLAADTAAFAVIFGIFVVALVVLIFITLRWTFRRDKAGREAWRERQAGGASAMEGETPPAPKA